MRKYYQAALALTAALSLVALLFYRHEYNKLRFVLQVFNYFGSPSKTPNDTCSLATTAEDFKTDFSEPTATWHRLSNDLYVYSAYHMDHTVKAIAFGSPKNLKDPITCAITTNPENPQKQTGTFSFEVTSPDDLPVNIDSSKFYTLTLNCKSSHLPKNAQITGVEFTRKNEDTLRRLKMKVRSIEKNATRNDSVICVAPPNFDKNDHVAMKRIDMMTFIAFHSNISLNNYIVYDFGIADSFNYALKSLSHVAGMNFTYSTVSWNFPFDGVDYKVIRHIVEADCFYRSFGRAKLAVTLTWNEYINLRYHSSLSRAVDDLNKASLRSEGSFDVGTFVMCVEESERDFNFSTPMILSTTKGLRGEDRGEERHVYGLRNEGIFGKGTRRKMEDLASVYKYEECNGDQEVVEGQVLNGADKTPGSKIFQYYLTRKLFSP